MRELSLARLQNEAQRGDWLARRLERAGPAERLRMSRLRLAGLEAPLGRAMERRLAGGRHRLQLLKAALERSHPRRQLLERRERLAGISRRLLVARERLMPRWRAALDRRRIDRDTLARRLREERSRLVGLARQLEALGPAQVQRRGYALVETRETPAALIKRAAEVEARGGPAGHLPLRLRFVDGDVPVEWRALDGSGQGDDGA